MNDTLSQVEHTPPVHKRILDIMPGISGGVARVMIGQPFDTIKVRLQVLGQGTALAAKLPPSEVYKDSMDCVRKMIRAEGPLSFYKGTVAPLFGNMILLGIHFPTFSAVRKSLEGDDHYTNFSSTNVLISGAAAGAAGSLVSTPVELVRTKMQLQRRAALASTVIAPAGAAATEEAFYKGSVDCFKQVLAKHGVKGLYRGFSSTIVRDMQGYAWFFLGYEAMVNYYLQNAGPGVHTKADLNYLQVMSAGVIAGFGLWGSMFPIDTVKSKMQADNLAKPAYSSTMDCVSKVLKQEGHMGLWRGFSAAMYRAIPVNAGIFLAVEGARQSIKLYEEKVEHVYGGVVGQATA
ncbi:putative mitochondrial carrier C4G9.20c [Tetrabaena socialis]|uniref:Putative mitochondrial carrier C4G9.20c n=1 Tax=Tetrabaena socialis TaxID=47790 RepID=A0A2J8ABR2_9CHLO|nr:putative mitochondrial carrier C4G9.20c [Tetrabaena socialis]|eukprot:PNH09961.1 putative mitochondrial carrier C4G9.20c [Tetrabaena socialis]